MKNTNFVATEKIKMSSVLSPIFAVQDNSRATLSEICFTAECQTVVMNLVVCCLQGNSNRDSSIDSISARELINQTDYLKQQMIDLSKETQVDTPSSLSLIDPQEALKRYRNVTTVQLRYNDSVMSILGYNISQCMVPCDITY